MIMKNLEKEERKSRRKDTISYSRCTKTLREKQIQNLRKEKAKQKHFIFEDLGTEG